jgi:hypothetical protein
MDINIKYLSDEMCRISSKESNYHPIDRYFIDKHYINDILNSNYLDFIIYNLETTSNLYSEQLLLCLPEIWKDLTFEKIQFILESLTTSFSFYSFLRFTYKYVEVDFLDEVLLNNKITLQFKKDICSYFKNIVSTFYKDDDDYYDFNENLIGVKLEDWKDVKIKLLKDNRMKPVCLSIEELYLKLSLNEEENLPSVSTSIS